MYKSVSAQEAVKIIKSNDRVYIQAGAAAPQSLIKAMTERSDELINNLSQNYIPEGEAPYLLRS